jgi:hypothetical protein
MAVKKIKVFIASAGSLADERNKLEVFVARQNDELVEKGVYVELVIWEKLSLAFSQERKQQEFNAALLKSDIMICLIHDKVGPFTKEEFDKAYQSFSKGGKPKKLYVFFKEGPVELSSVTKQMLKVSRLKKQISQYQQVYDTYRSVEELLLKISTHFQDDVRQVIEKTLPERVLEVLDGINPQIHKRLAAGNLMTQIVVGVDKIPELEKVMAEANKALIAAMQSNGNSVGAGSYNIQIGNALNDVDGEGKERYGFNIMRGPAYPAK